jgi:hypothetical protein
MERYTDAFSKQDQNSINPFGSPNPGMGHMHYAIMYKLALLVNLLILKRNPLSAKFSATDSVGKMYV